MKVLLLSLSLYIAFCAVFLFPYKLLAYSDQALKQTIQQKLAEQKLTGAVWAVIDSDGCITTASAGIKNNDTKTALRANDKVHVGSVTKTVLAAGILQLATAGKLKLEDPVTKYLPDVKFINKWEQTDPVTIRHLLDHTSGLSDLRMWHMLSTTARPDLPLSEFNTRDSELLTLQNKPGSIFSYSNMGYTLLGMLLEAVTGQRYEHYLDEHLLKPLGMHNSTFRFLSQTGPAADKALAMGHLDKGKTFAALPIYVRPAGQFTTTAYDMGLFLRFMMGDGQLNGNPFIDKAYLNQLGKTTNTKAAKSGLPYGYALGAAYRDRHGVLGIAHSGNIVGYRAMCYMFPDDKKAFFIAHNMDSETADYEVFNEIMIRHLNVATPSQAFEAVNATALHNWDGYYVPASVKVEPFGFLDYVSGFTKVSVQEKGATFSPFQKQAVRLHYVGNQLFIAEGKVVPSHAFYSEANGQYYITNGLSTVRKTSGWKILLAGISFVSGIASMIFLILSGIYQVIRFRTKRWRLPLVWYLLSLAIMLFGVSYMFTQSFVALGDKNMGTMLLAAGTLLLPVVTLFSIYNNLKRDLNSVLPKLDLLCLVLILQFLVVLLFNGMLPLILWR